MGAASIGEDHPEDLRGTALYFLEKGWKDILQILLHYGFDVNQKDCKGKMVLSRMEENGGEISSSMVGENGGEMALIIFDNNLNTFDELSMKATVSAKPSIFINHSYDMFQYLEPFFKTKIQTG